MNEIFDRGVHPLYSVMAAVCAIAVIIVLIRTSKDKNSEKTASHVVLYRWVVYFCLQDALWGIFAAHIITSDALLFATSALFHLSSAVMTIVWVYYLISTIKQVRYERLMKGLDWFLVAVQIILLLANFFRNFMFYIDDEGFYASTGYRYIIFYLQFIVYIAIGIVSISAVFVKKQERKKLLNLTTDDAMGEPVPKERTVGVKFMENPAQRVAEQQSEEEYSLLAVFFINLAPLVAGIFQMLYPDAPANSIGFSIGCIIVYTYIAAANEKKIAKLNAEKAYRKIIEMQNLSLREKEASLVKALQEAELANKAKSTFLFNMSHDIRTPMNAIIGYTEMALRHRSEEKTMLDSLRKIKSSSDFLLSIINDILDMARIEAGKISIEEKVVRITDINESLTQMVKINASAKDIKVNSDCEALVDTYVWADQNHINQVISNLLSNAIKYTNKGGEIWHIVRQIPCSRDGYGCFQTIIRDNGIGMSEEFVKKIFEQFEREKTSTVSGIQGTGLGMSIVKTLVDMMHGDIVIESEPGKGTRVTVTFEHKIATEEEVAEFYTPTASKDGIISDNELEGIKVLLVEDNEMNREIALDILTESGIQVDTAEDGDIAYQKVLNSKPGQYDLILMDVQMPRLNGYEATRLIRKIENDDIAGIPIVAMTANAFEEDKQNALDAGMNGHLSKPIEVHKLITLLKSIKTNQVNRW